MTLESALTMPATLRFFAWLAQIRDAIARFFAKFTVDRATAYTYDVDGCGRLYEYVRHSCRSPETTQDSVPCGEEPERALFSAAPGRSRRKAGETLMRRTWLYQTRKTSSSA